MVLGKIIPFPPLVSSLPNDSPRLLEQPAVCHVEEEGSSRMGDDGCPNESPEGDDATGYSEEEEEALSQEAESTSVGTAVEKIGSKKW
jgi:hypothetical protein